MTDDTCIVCDELIGDEDWEPFSIVTPGDRPLDCDGLDEHVAEHPDATVEHRVIHMTCKQELTPLVETRPDQ